MTDLAKRDADGQEDYLGDLLDKLIETYEGKRHSARSATRTLKAMLILLGGITTVLIGLREFSTFSGIGEQIGIITLVLSALTTAATAWDGFNNSSWKWAHYRDMLGRLYGIRDKLNFDRLNPDDWTEDRCRAHFEEVQQLLSEDREKWLKVRAENITGRKP